MKTEESILGAGCFWGVEEILRQIPGVISTEVGYAGGTSDHPRYEQVKTGKTGHAEAVRILFDPNTLSYDHLLDYFFRLHDPTTLNRQGGDIGTQYRSVIFYFTPEQQKIAKEKKRAVEASGKWTKPLVTEITPAPNFFTAEEYHQDYLIKNPGGYSCHYLRN